MNANETLVDTELSNDIERIEGALSRHSCTEALAWCSENKTALHKMNITLEFDLRLQEYIELARALKYAEAIEYLRKYLASESWQVHREQLQQAMAMLAHRPNTMFERYKRLYDPERWTALVESFRLAVHSLDALDSMPEPESEADRTGDGQPDAAGGEANNNGSQEENYDNEPEYDGEHDFAEDGVGDPDQYSDPNLTEEQMESLWRDAALASLERESNRTPSENDVDATMAEIEEE